MAGQNTLIVKLPYSASSASAINSAMQAALSKAPRAAPASISKEAASDKITTHFTQSQLALALAIQKAKPEDLSTNEYCQQLRNSIKSGQPVSSVGLRYIDTCEFWKDQYTKIHWEKKALQDKVHRLEEARQQLLESLHDQFNHASPDGSGRKLLRGPEFDDPIASEASGKRPAPIQQEIAEYRQEGDIESSSSEKIFLRLSNYVLRIGRQRSNMKNASTDSSTLEQVNTLAKHIIQTLMLLENALSDTCLPLKLLKTDSEDQRGSLLIQQVMHQVQLSFLSCFNCLNELCLTIPGRANIPEIVYRMILFIKKALYLLHDLGKLQFEHEAVQDSQRPRHKRSRTEEREYVVNKYLAKSIASTFYGLNWKIRKPSHAELLEGMLFCILEHAGRLVSEAVFSEHVAASDNPGNITKCDDPVAGGILKKESRYVVQILQAALGGSTRKELIAQVLTERKPNANEQSHLGGSTLSFALSSDLLFKAKKLLQSTLVKSAVGGPDLDTLRLPTPPIEELEQENQVSDKVEKYGSEWLIESVWGIIGWDIIA